MNLQSWTRWKAFVVHLAISALIASTVFILIMLVWYPRPYFEAMGGALLLRLLIGVDVVLGPLITLIIFDPAKPRLKFDLACIATLQIVALIYGSYVMFEARPVYNVFYKNAFNTVPANLIVDTSLARAPDAFRDLPVTGPRVVAARPPVSADENASLMLSAMSGGPEIVQLPHLYVPYADSAMSAASSARPLVDLSRRSKETADAVSEFVASSAKDGRNLGYLPVKARNKDFAAVVDRKTGEIVGYLAVYPW
ncbi:MAG: hypothetical protein IT518_09870 [Burkholderiales bacterium]|nr:hypothetical protein [Burkholderiales bacterium]